MEEQDMTKKIIALTLALVMVFALAACGAGSTTTTAPASAAATTETAEAAPAATTAEIVDDTTGLKIPCEPITLSMGCSGTMDGTASGIAIDKYLAELKDWTDGNFVINFYPSGQLGGDAELIEGVQMGSVDIFMGAPSTQIGLIPELAILDISGLYENIDQCNAVLGGGLLDILAPYYKNANLRLLTCFATSFRITSSNKPLDSMDALKGLKIRTQENKYHMAFWKALGANPTPLAFGELYIALQQGMMDAQENPWVSYVGAKLCEVQSNMTFTNHIPFMLTLVCSESKYQSLSDAQKQALDQFCYSLQKEISATSPADDLRMQQMCEEQYGLVCADLADDIRAAYPAATQAVVDLMKQDVDPALVDSYVAAAQAAVAASK